MSDTSLLTKDVFRIRHKFFGLGECSFEDMSHDRHFLNKNWFSRRFFSKAYWLWFSPWYDLDNFLSIQLEFLWFVSKSVCRNNYFNMHRITSTTWLNKLVKNFLRDKFQGLLSFLFLYMCSCLVCISSSYMSRTDTHLFCIHVLSFVEVAPW